MPIQIAMPLSCPPRSSSLQPEVLRPDGAPLFGEGYEFQPGVDDIVCTGTAGYIVAFGDALYR